MLPAPSSMRHVPNGSQHHGFCTHALPQANIWQTRLLQIATMHWSDNSSHEMQSAQQQHALSRKHSGVPSLPGVVGQQGVQQSKLQQSQLPGIWEGNLGSGLGT